MLTYNAELTGAKRPVRNKMTNEVERVVMRQTTTDEGKTMWWIDAPDFYCDVEQEPSGSFSVYFRHKQSDREILMTHNDGAERQQAAQR